MYPARRGAAVFDPAVGLCIDGMYVANGRGPMGTLLDVDSVEVVRGSQGTLFGRDNTGGSILLRTHRPDLEHAAAEVALSGGDYGEFMDRAIQDFGWQDKIEFNVINDFNCQGAYGTANARVALASRARAWEIAVFGTNLTDKRYAYTGGTLCAPLVPIPTIAWNIPGARRTAGVEGTYRWNPAR
jgi:outer membrane receptor protein involved in Fe transport